MLYDELRSRYKALAVGALLKCLSAARRRETVSRRRRLRCDPLDDTPLVSEGTTSDSIPARFFVNRGLRYHCERGRARLLALHLPTFRREDSPVAAGEEVRVAPFVAHAFLTPPEELASTCITVRGRPPWGYSFDVDPGYAYSEKPDDLRLDLSKLRVGEQVLRRAALRHADRPLTHVSYSALLSAARNAGTLFAMSGFEQALVLNMAFDWVQRLHATKERLAYMAFGAYRRLAAPSGDGYHFITPSRIKSGTGPCVELEHITHLGDLSKVPLPRIQLGRNVVVEKWIETGLGLVIGELSWIASDGSFLKHEHKPQGGGQYSRAVENTRSYPTEIGPHAFVGLRASILPHAVYIGKGAVIGHSAVAARSVGDYAIAAGNPARVVRYNVELAQRLEEASAPEGGGRTDECAIVEDGAFLARVQERRQLVIVGAVTVRMVVSAARRFERVLAVHCCVGQVVRLLEELNNQGLRNVCLESGGTQLIWELELRRGVPVAWVGRDGAERWAGEDVLRAVSTYSKYVCARAGGRLAVLLDASPDWSKVDNLGEALAIYVAK